MLVDQKNPDVLSLRGKSIESLFNCRIICLAVHNQEVLLRIRGFGDMLNQISAFNLEVIDLNPYTNTCQQKARHGVLD
jgi:hypothetical protein